MKKIILKCIYNNVTKEKKKLIEFNDGEFILIDIHRL